jgi:hypothetical protein
MRTLSFLALSILCGCGGATTPEAAFPGTSESVQIVDPQIEAASGRDKLRWAAARDVLERRCAVCHGCYDAPCQLKLESFKGIERGATNKAVYEASRLTATDPTRLFIDAHGVEAWRELGFHGVLPEGTPFAPGKSPLLRMLALKSEHPLPPNGDLEEHFTFALDRKASCPKAEDFDAFAKEHPYWGMPYGLPALTPSERAAIEDWVREGAVYPGEPELAPGLVAAVARWERLLNQSSLKAKLVSRYLYEHLFLAGLYFSDIDKSTFLRLVRSSTPPGEPVAEIATRRPFDSPGAAPFYYRFVRRVGTPLAKTHMPYALHDARMKRWNELFFDAQYEVDALPSYDLSIAGNPFKAFEAIPVSARYRFLLDEAQFTMMNFIKGPVCRGQVALNVIQERFWIAFIDPDVPWVAAGSPMLVQHETDMPAEEGSDAWLTRWAEYQRAHMVYTKNKSAVLHETHPRGVAVDVLWDGEGENANAALTVLRHFDSATVVKGLVGGAPKTAWVIDFPLLERIHYLLAAGFDVFGNVGHQVMTRLYMDFLRMEGESNFLAFLTPEDRRAQVDAWYEGIDEARMKLLYEELHDSSLQAGVRYTTRDHKRELLGMIEAKLATVRSKQHELSELDDEAGVAALEELARITGPAATAWPEVTFIALRGAKPPASRSRESMRDAFDRMEPYLSVLRDSAHTNVAELFNEDERRAPADDGLTVLRGFTAAYPNRFLAIDREQLKAFVAAAKKVKTPAELAALMDKHTVGRLSPELWPFVDELHEAYWADVPIEAGLIDLSRLEAR